MAHPDPYSQRPACQHPVDPARPTTTASALSISVMMASDPADGGVDEEITDATKWSEETAQPAAMAPIAVTTGLRRLRGTTFLNSGLDCQVRISRQFRRRRRRPGHRRRRDYRRRGVERWNSPPVQWDPIETVEVTLAEGGQSYLPALEPWPTSTASLRMERPTPTASVP